VRRGGVNQTMVTNIPATKEVTVTLTANVTSIGTYSISTNKINGIVFSGSGTFTTLGANTITLFAYGTPLNAGNYTWLTQGTPAISIDGSVLTKSAPLGSSYQSHFNGGLLNAATTVFLSYQSGERFGLGADDCKDKPVSVSNCENEPRGFNGQIYTLEEINGQCWLKTNVIDQPTRVYSSASTTQWTNVADIGDQGFKGFYNADQAGTPGWGASEITAGDGRLYQWCAAMDGTISERSRGICPLDFHIPSDCEWMYLEWGLGMHSTEIIKTAYRGAGTVENNATYGSVGTKLKLNNNNIVSGFNFLLAGHRNFNAVYFDRTQGHIWTSTSTSISVTLAYVRGVNSTALNTRGVDRSLFDKSRALSVRCVKD
jgi:uncharacterized protein (TIGR02145 family)